MTEYRRQHFIPKFYLKNFSEDKKALCRYSLKNKMSERSNISKACTARDFYAKAEAADFEKTMSGLEAVHAKIVRKIVTERSLALISEEEFLHLCNFVLLMKTRDKASKKEIEKMENLLLDWLKPSFAQSEEAKEKGITLEDLKKVRLTRDSANFEAMLIAMKGAPLIADLTATLLINKTKRPFITCDSPVLFTNYVTVDARRGNMGYLSRGLMIFLPLTEEITLWLFDATFYEPDANSKGNVNVTRKQDISALNRLQIIIADEYVFFSKPDDRDYVLLLHDERCANQRAMYSSPIVANATPEIHEQMSDLSHKKIRRKHRFSFFETNERTIQHFQKIAADPRHLSYALYRNEELARTAFSELEEIGKAGG